jgi:hypothetical protein
MKALAVLILCYVMIVMIGKFIQRPNFLGYLFVAVMTAAQVAFMLFYMYTMEVPTP